MTTVFIASSSHDIFIDKVKEQSRRALPSQMWISTLGGRIDLPLAVSFSNNCRKWRLLAVGRGFSKIGVPFKGSPPQRARSTKSVGGRRWQKKWFAFSGVAEMAIFEIFTLPPQQSPLFCSFPVSLSTPPTAFASSGRQADGGRENGLKGLLHDRLLLHLRANRVLLKSESYRSPLWWFRETAPFKNDLFTICVFLRTHRSF